MISEEFQSYILEFSTATFILTFQENARVSPKNKDITAALGVLNLLDEILNPNSNLLTGVLNPGLKESNLHRGEKLQNFTLSN